MLVKFDEPQKGELLYSVLARQVISGDEGAKDRMKVLFGTKTASASILLPGRIDSLLNNVPANAPYTSEELINDHTLFRYYTAFFSKERTAGIRSKMKSENGGGIISGSGIMASAISQEPYFKVCPSCVKEMNENATFYWQRLFQLPEVKICPFHNEILHTTNTLKRGSNKHEFHSASFDALVTSTSIRLKDQFKEDLRFIASQIEWILTHDFQRRSLQWIKQRYMGIMILKGLANVNNRIHISVLVSDFIKFYGHEFLEMFQVDFNEESETNWLMDIVRGNRRESAPIKHLLLIRYFGMTFEEFMKASEEYTPFGSGPWKCLNPICPDHGNYVIDDVRLEYSNDTKQTRGLFAHDRCGYSYYRYEESETVRIMCYGELWDKKLRKLIRERSSLRSIAEILGVDPKTVVSHANRLGVKHSSNMSVYKPKGYITESDEDKVEWIQLIEQHPDKGVTALRSLKPALYTRLYRNEREWLKINSPRTTKREKTSSRVDWGKRDTEVSKQIKVATDTILESDDYPVRISLSRIGKSINKLALLERHLDELPLSKGILEQVVESDSEYRRRRIEWVVRSLEANGDEIKEWQVYRLAGIRLEYQEELREFTQELIDG